MKIAVEKQTPVTALATLIAIVAASYTRYGTAPFENEEVSARVVPPLAEYLSAFGASHPVVSIIAAAIMTIAAGMIIGIMVSRFNIYPTQTFISMPLYGVVACGIFISRDALSAALSSLLAAMAVRYLVCGYLRERDLSSMLYSGLAVGTMLLVSPSGAAYAVAVMIAVFVLSFSARELLVLMTAAVFPPAVFCYAVWAFGGEFAAPAIRIREALISESGVATFGNDAVAALVLCGLTAFTFVSSAVLFQANRFMVSVKSRGILIYILLLSLLSAAMMFLPSSTPAALAVAAVPMSMIMPVVFIREGERLSAILYLSSAVVFVLHLLYY
ncbi:MAG: hypothetical protein J1E04_06225 [Alistipes sp.]|nr:hypothetical protein [Alistipes sp.]